MNLPDGSLVAGNSTIDVATTPAVKASAPAPDGHRRRWLLGACALHVFGVLTPVVGYLGWYEPAQQKVAKAQLQIIGVIGPMCLEYGALYEGKDFGDDEQARRAAAFAYRDGMRELSPRLSAFLNAMDHEMKAATQTFSLCYAVGVVIAFVGLAVGLVLGSRMSRFAGVVACGAVGVVWGAATGMLADSFPFEVFFLPPMRTIDDHSGLIGGALIFGAGGLALGWIAASLANTEEAKKETVSNPV